LTVVAEAKPATICAAVNTCFRSKNAEELANIDAPEIMFVPLRVNVKVADVEAVFATTMFVTIVVVLAGTV